MFKIAVIGGDGIGPEVASQAVRILKKVSRFLNEEFSFIELKAGGIAIDSFGVPLPQETLNKVLTSNAILLGAVGGPKWDSLPYELRPERALLGLRKSLELYANLRPAIMFESLVSASSLKPEVVRAIDILVVRELTGGIYFGKPAEIVNENGVRRGINTMTYNEREIRRIAETAFKVAAVRRKKVTSVDKANILHTSMLWREVVTDVHRAYAGIQLEHIYVDNAAMQLVRNPKQFDVMLTENMFGDILSDEAAMLTGSIGMLPSASLGERHALYEPVHGSAPDIAGEGVANPIASILSVAMLAEHSLQNPALSRKIFQAVENVLSQGYRTADIASSESTVVSTEEMGRLIEEAFRVD